MDETQIESKLDAMTKEERSQLLYLESRAVDHRGFVDARHMNAGDFEICEKWSAANFIRFSRIPSNLWKTADAMCKPVGSARHVVQLSELAWHTAGLERKRRSNRMMNQVLELSLEHFEGLKTGDTIRTIEGVFTKK